MSLLRLYDYGPSANCYKVRLLLAQLEPFERVAIDIFDGDTLTQEYERLNPFRSTPVLQFPDGRTLIESNAILWFVASGTAFLPDDPIGQAEVCRWLIYEQSDVMPMIGGLRFRLLTNRFTPDSDEAKRPLHDRRLATFAYSHVTEEAGIDTSAYTAFKSWLDRVGSPPRFVDDLQSYPPNASAKVGRSVYE
jgi:glutathione S-transferase